MQSKRPFRLLLPLAFLGGILLGWLVIGWWLWPVQWANVSPAQMAPEYQQTYVAAVAEAYALTGDVAQAQSRLAAWDDTTLANTLTLLIQQTTDPLVRGRYMALGEALAMPQVDASLLDVILGQIAILVTAVAAIGLFLAALGLAIFPSIQKARIRQQEEKRLLAGLDPNAGMVEDGPTAVGPANAAAPQRAAAVNPAGEPAPTGDTAPTTPPAVNPNEQADGGAGGEAVAAAGQPGAVRAGNNQQSAQNPAQAAPANAAAQPTAQPTATPPNQPDNAPPANDQELLEASQEKLLTETAGNIQELLNSIFEEDDKFAHFEILLQGLGDVDMAQLAQRSDQILRRLQQMNRQAN